MEASEGSRLGHSYTNGFQVLPSLFYGLPAQSHSNYLGPSWQMAIRGQAPLE